VKCVAAGVKVTESHLASFDSFFLCQHNNGYTDGRSQIQVHTDEWTQVHSARSSLVVTHPSTNQGRRALWFQHNVTPNYCDESLLPEKT